MRVTNKFNLPGPVVAALTADDYSRGDSNRSVTQLIDSPRIRILKKEHRDEITKDASDLIWIALGKGIHKIFEDHAGGKWKPEERMYANIMGWRVSGQVDIQEVDGDVIDLNDYKITSVYSYIFGKVEYEYQLNFYAWLARQNGLKVRALYIVFVFRDWKMREAKQNPDYPEAPIMVVPVPLWPDKQQDMYVSERIQLHQDAEFNRLAGEELPLCSDEERWVRGEAWAVRKNENKNAVRGGVKDNEEDANAMRDELAEADPKNKYWVEHRPGTANRCADYCSVSEWCSQWKAELEEAA